MCWYQLRKLPSCKKHFGICISSTCGKRSFIRAGLAVLLQKPEVTSSTLKGAGEAGEPQPAAGSGSAMLAAVVASQ